MIFLYTDHETERERKKAKVCLLSAGGILLAALTACVVLCFHVRTGNESRLFKLTVALFTLAGWTAILLYSLGYKPAQAEYRHREHILKGESQAYEGVLTVSGGAFRIPKSITVKKAAIATGEETVRLNLDASLAGRMPPDGTKVRVLTVRQYITAFEVCDEKD